MAAGTRTIDLTDRQTVDKEPGAFRTISEVAEELDVPQHVLRFWETRFSQIKPLKRGGGRRFYRPDDVLLIRGVRHLLYGEGYTIKGVQRILKEEGVRFVQQVGSGSRPDDAPMASAPAPAENWDGDGWQSDGFQTGSDDDFPSVVRPQPYNSAWQGGDVMASPPVAGWRDATPGQASAAALTSDPHAPQGYGAGDDPAQGWPAAGDAFQPQPEQAGQGAASFDAAAWSDAQSHGPAPLARSTPVAAHRPDVWNDAPETSHASAPEGFHAGGAWDGAPDLGPGAGYARPALAGAQRARLQEALAELLECRRLLAHARGELDSAD
ncbi:hypothetical protein GCM10019059_15710 [Camelimonas fluminis]|nr:hypothetical protein GCM10019059_15710 [Camelimonas fluminis]